jgi:VIT1/CCC1 family predicted Fe2+/Mn2+ transporter
MKTKSKAKTSDKTQPEAGVKSGVKTKERSIPGSLITMLLKIQKNEITEHHIYSRLAGSIKGEKNVKVLKKIAADEKTHYEFWKNYTSADVKPGRWRIFKFYWTSRIFGLTFGLKLMERGEAAAKINYEALSEYIRDAKKIAHEEDVHENQLLSLIEEEKLEYAGSIVLGLNDALVELTGALAGLTFALQNTKLIALAGLITGIAASFSMAASEYLSQRTDADAESPLKSAVYTGIAYIITVILLIMPYLLFTHFMICLAMTLLIALFIIFFFNYYISVAKDLDFKARFLEMAFISLGVSAITFLIGVLIRQFLGIEV